LIDLYLPADRGEDSIAALRAARPELPLILVTDSAGYRLRERFAGDNGVQILTKPFDTDALRRVLTTFGLAIHGPAKRPGE
jgi:CheY-like chemotaxis protein